MKKIKAIICILFTLGIICLGFSFVSFNGKTDCVFAYSSQIVLENSTFVMAGGTISSTIGDNGGAVYVGEGATFTMTGGKIKNCSAINGGAVYVANGGIFNFDGGTIENCSADLGSAIYVQAGGTLNYKNNADGFTGCGEDEDIHVYAEEGATVIAPGTPINIYVDGALSKTIKKSGDTYTINEAEMPLDYESCCGYFLDGELRTTIKNNTIDLSNGDVKIYTRTASEPDTYFTFTENTTTGTYDIKAKNTSISGDIVLPKEYNNVQTSIMVPTTGSLIGNLPGAFSSCFAITGITFQEGLIEVPETAFKSCSGLTGNLIIPDSVTSIGHSAFYSCSGLTGELIIPNSVTSIGDSAFRSCSGFTGSLIIPDSVASIGNNAFYSCRGLTSLTLGNSVTNIGYFAFSFCGLTGSLTITDSVTTIEYNVFATCAGLTSVYIPSSVTTISASTYYYSPFYTCSSSLVIYTDVANAESIPSGWGECWNYYDVENQLEVVYGCSLDSDGNIIEPAKINIYVDGASTPTKVLNPGGTSYTVQESDMPLEYENCCGYFLDSELMTTIKNNTIDLTKGDVNLYTRTATDSSYFTFEMNKITGNYDIVDTSLTKVDVVLPKEYQGIQVGLGITDERYDPETTRPVFVRKSITSITLPSGITEIIDYAFYYCSSIKVGLIIPDSVISIGEHAFSNCSGLTSVTIPDSVTSIGYNAFQSCDGLTSVTIGNSVTSIGNYTFSNCRKLTSVTIPNSVTSIGEYAFHYCIGLTSVTIGNSVTSIGNSAFSSCEGLISLTFGNGVTSIGKYAFNYCSGLTSVYIPSSVTTISASGYYNAPFYGCSSSLVIYTDVANASSKPSGWSKYWNYKSSSETYTTNYGYTLEQYKSAVGLTFAPRGENANSENIETVEVVKVCQTDDYLNEIIIEKRDYIILPKKQIKIYG